jgi:hypothetical protein
MTCFCSVELGFRFWYLWYTSAALVDAAGWYVSLLTTHYIVVDACCVVILIRRYRNSGTYENLHNYDLHGSHCNIKSVRSFESEQPFSLTALQKSTLLGHSRFCAPDIPSFNLVIRVIYVVPYACSNQSALSAPPSL